MHLHCDLVMMTSQSSRVFLCNCVFLADGTSVSHRQTDRPTKINNFFLN